MIARYEKGQIPSTRTLQKLARALDAKVRITPEGWIKITPVEEIPKAAYRQLCP